MQTEFDLHYPSSKVEIFGINQKGFEIGNGSITAERDLPWLQDVDNDGDGQSDVWLNSWAYEYRDVVLVDADGGALEAYGLTQNDLSVTENYEELKQKFIDVANLEQKTRWQSAVEPLDVDGNSRISPIDALHVVNELGKYEEGILPQLGDVTNHVDTNGDGRVGPLDALLVINQLNAIVAASAQAVPLSASALSASAVPAAESLAAESSLGSDSQEAAMDATAVGLAAELPSDIDRLWGRRYRFAEERTNFVSSSDSDSNSNPDSARDELFGALNDARLF